jgi:hypothetical protein
LSARVDGDIHLDSGSRAAYSTDASNYCTWRKRWLPPCPFRQD